MNRGLARLQQGSRELEASAATIRSSQPVLVPDLLQVPESARRIFAAGNPKHSPTDIAVAVAARMDRQLLLYEGSARFEFVITEAALRWRVGPPQVMLAQRPDHRRYQPGFRGRTSDPAGYRARHLA